MKAVLCILVLELAVALGTTWIPSTSPTLIPPTVPKGCYYNGAFYKPGEQFSPTPCMFCHCDVSGRHMCAIADCALPPCVDAVSPNCRAPDGTLIKEGETYTTSKGAVCRCPLHQGHFWGAQNAICAIQLTPLPTVDKEELAVSK
ncbi:von Willebrand factor C domain-containing protein 2-like protein [Elysia marginata]|uniref:von Willebrand factor C domain-containing protein 2-like protein n=1 Tax=Elysia marginata TaxID=1093978 RepID=A0AAV4HPJ3_9GAST|nr:von Willebrand factor C domain-containing protein 2-like protein [Elysia marginata]